MTYHSLNDPEFNERSKNPNDTTSNYKKSIDYPINKATDDGTRKNTNNSYNLKKKIVKTSSSSDKKTKVQLTMRIAQMIMWTIPRMDGPPQYPISSVWL